MAPPIETELGTAGRSSPKLNVSHVVSDQPPTASSSAPHPELYSVFSAPQKRWIVFLAAFAGWFSTLSSFIFFPAITAIANDLHTSVEKINLTVTSYLIVSGLAPSFVGETAENYGRRPVYMVAFLIYISANVGLALQSSFPALFIIRMIQSAGISGGKIAHVSEGSPRAHSFRIICHYLWCSHRHCKSCGERVLYWSDSFWVCLTQGDSYGVLRDQLISASGPTLHLALGQF